jgi:hypothetical protein
MNTEQDPYWDDLGVAWLAVNPDPKAIEARLNMRLRSQAYWARLLMAIGLPLCIALLALAAYTVYAGLASGAWHFVVRGIALLLLSGMTGSAAWSQRARFPGNHDSVTQTIDLAIARGRNFRRAAGMGMAMCGVAAVSGVVGYFARTRLGHPPAMSPWEPLALLALMATTLLVYLRFTAEELDRLRYLKGVLSPESLREPS